MIDTTGKASATDPGGAELDARVDTADWTELTAEVNEYGCALTPPLLTAAQCQEIAGWFTETERFRSTIDMNRLRFGSGVYRYFDNPVPEPIARLREVLYPHLLNIARDWAEKLRQDAPWPDTYGEWLEMCHRAGQTKPTPLLLHYQAGDWNALHQDLYGDLVFPLQVAIGLDRPGIDYTGGEFLLVEQRPRAQSRGTARTLEQGRGLIFTTRERPVATKRGWSKGPVRHGVSTVRSGRRHTLGLVFHDAA